MEVELITHATQWLASQRDTQVTHAIILTDSVNLLQKVESGMGCPDWHTAMNRGINGPIDWQAQQTSHMAVQLGKAEVLRGLRYFLNTDRQEHHTTDRQKVRGVEKGSGRHSTLRGRERSVFNKTLTPLRG